MKVRVSKASVSGPRRSKDEIVRDMFADNGPEIKFTTQKEYEKLVAEYYKKELRKIRSEMSSSIKNAFDVGLSDMKKQEDGISATIQETIRSELERILPDAIREAIEDSIDELTSSCEGTVGHELTVCSKDKSCVIKTNGEASVHGPVTVNGEPNKWLLNVINTRSQLITMGVYASKDEAGQALQSLMNAYTGGFSKIFL